MNAKPQNVKANNGMPTEKNSRPGLRKLTSLLSPEQNRHWYSVFTCGGSVVTSTRDVALNVLRLHLGQRNQPSPLRNSVARRMMVMPNVYA
jgi:hypothetical protein